MLRLVTARRDQYVVAVWHVQMPCDLVSFLVGPRRRGLFQAMQTLPEVTKGVNRRPVYCELLDLIDCVPRAQFRERLANVARVRYLDTWAHAGICWRQPL